MSLNTDTIEVDPESEVGDLLAQAENAPIVLTRNGVRFRLEREPNELEAGYDPERLREELRRHAGTLEPEDGERWQEMIYRGREEGS